MTTRGRWILAGLLLLSLVTGVISIEETVHAPARSVALIHDPPTGPTILLHAPLVGGLGLWAILRAARWNVPASRAIVLRIAGWILLPVLLALTWPPESGSLNESPRAIALAASTTLVPVLPMLAGGLLFDLALHVCRAEDRRRFASPRIPAGAVFGAVFGGTLAYAWTGFYAFGSMLNEWAGPMRFEHLGAPAFFAGLTLLIQIPVGILWAIVAAARN